MIPSAKAYSVVSALMGVALSAIVMVTVVVAADQLLSVTRSNQARLEASRVALSIADRYRRGEAIASTTSTFSNGYGYYLDVSEATKPELTRLDIAISWTLRGAFPASAAACDQNLRLSAVRSTGRSP